MRIILADPHEKPLEALKEALDSEPEFQLMGTAADAQGLFDLAKKMPTDLILLDKDLPGMDIIEVIVRLHDLDPRPIVMTMSCELQDSRKLLRAGADAYVSKGDEPTWLLETLRKFESRSNKNMNDASL